jgi:bla regulator protein BlaR1
VTQWLVGTLLATSVLMLLVLLVREPVRRHFGARVAYGLWLVPAARLLMPTLTETVERPGPVAAPLLPAIGAPELSHLGNSIGWPIVMLNSWLVVALALFTVRIIQFRRQRAAILTAADEVDRAGSIRIVRSSTVRGPVAFGIIDRVIAVPIDFETRYSEHERALALNHELAHHRSGDLIANFVAFILLCLQWFNPLAWIAHSAFRFDQEAACDARVLDQARCSRADYGRAIAKASSGRAILFAGALDRRSTLHKRLKCMLANPTSGQRVTGRLMILATVAVVLPLTATRAVNYVDVPAAHQIFQAATPLQPMSSVPPVAPRIVGRTAQPKSQNRNSTPDGGPQFRVVPDDVQHQTRKSGRARRVGELARIDVDQKGEPASKDADQARRDLMQLRSEADQARREQEQFLRDTDQQRREQARRDADQARRDMEQLRREADQTRREQQQFPKDADHTQRERTDSSTSKRTLTLVRHDRNADARNESVVRIEE